MGEVTTPTLVLWGDQDRVTPVYGAEIFDERIPDSRAIVFQNVGHIAMEEAPARTANAIDAFLGEKRENAANEQNEQ